VQTLLTLPTATISKLPNQKLVQKEPLCWYMQRFQNPFVGNALPVSNVCAHVATKVLVLAYCRTKLICILLPLYIIC